MTLSNSAAQILVVPLLPCTSHPERLVMQPAPVGTRIVVTSNEHGHSYTVGKTYTVSFVDNDGTLKAMDENGRVGNWLRWTDCRRAGTTDWTKIAARLPEPLVAFLSCFDGIAEICLGQRTVDAVLEGLPDLHERIVAAASMSGGKAVISGNRPALVDEKF
jgi:hypothetical protein